MARAGHVLLWDIGQTVDDCPDRWCVPRAGTRRESRRGADALDTFHNLSEYLVTRSRDFVHTARVHPRSVDFGHRGHLDSLHPPQTRKRLRARCPLAFYSRTGHQLMTELTDPVST